MHVGFFNALLSQQPAGERLYDILACSNSCRDTPSCVALECGVWVLFLVQFLGVSKVVVPGYGSGSCSWGWFLSVVPGCSSCRVILVFYSRQCFDVTVHPHYFTLCNQSEFEMIFAGFNLRYNAFPLLWSLRA